MKSISQMQTALGDIAKQLCGIASETDRENGALAGLNEEVQRLIEELQSAMYPHIFCPGSECMHPSEITVCYLLQGAHTRLLQILQRMLEPSESERITESFFSALPQVKKLLETDIQAAYDGDPAAKNKAEIVLAYPSFQAVSIYRLAHLLYESGVPMLPRIMTEYAHRTTAIDIHPGAKIGSYFFIDHGTGVVIGETTVIGSHVKLYQGVTLGAKSFDTDENGNPVKGIKRHPNIGERVVVYAGATILGGQTFIGDDCVIGGNVWLTHSVPAGTMVIATTDTPTYRIFEERGE